MIHSFTQRFCCVLVLALMPTGIAGAGENDCTDPVPVAVECLTRTTVTTAIRLTDNVCALLPGVENAAPDFADNQALAIAHIATEAACPEPRISAVVLAGPGDTNWH